MEKIVINATRRSVIGKQVGALRREGKLPGVIYGHKMDPVAITMDLREATLALTGLSKSHIVTINLEGKEHAALVREKQRNYVRNILLHVDFQAVSLSEKIRTKVGVEVSGISPAIKNFNAVLVVGLNEVEVEAYPQDLPESFVIDASKLQEIGDQILVKDLMVSEKVEILTDGDEVLAVITSGATEEIISEEELPSEPEVIERGKKEEEFED